jgi:hypothetical protein
MQPLKSVRRRKQSGRELATSDTLVLGRETQGSMVGRVKTTSPDEFHSSLAGGPVGVKGFDFRRVR